MTLRISLLLVFIAADANYLLRNQFHHEYRAAH
jgi:hypothetical protein